MKAFTVEILQVTNRFLPCTGGLELEIYNISKRLAERGYKISVYTSDEVGPNKRTKVKNEVIDGIYVHRFPFLRWWMSAEKSVMPTLLTSLLRKDADIVHTHSTFSINSCFASFVSKGRSKLVFTPLHPPLPPAHHLQPSSKVLIRLHNASTVRIALKFSDKIITKTEHEMMKLIEYGLEPEKLVKIPPAVDWSRFRKIPDGSTFRERYSLHEHVILTVSRIEKAKGLETLVRTASIIKQETLDVSFVIVGENWGYRKELDKLCEALKVKKCFIFTGFLTNEDLLKAYSSADVIVLPSEREGFGTVILEGAACGKPVVATRWTGLQELLRNSNVGVLFDYGNSKDLAQCLIKLILNKKSSKQMGQKGRNLVRKKFTYDVVARKTEHVYNSLTG